MTQERHSDETLLARRAAGDERATDELLRRYKSVVGTAAGKLFLRGGEHDDLVQEGMIGLFNAIQNFNVGSETSFSTYAHSCIRNRMLDAVKRGNRGKARALNRSLPLEDGNIERAHISPEELAILGDSRRKIAQALTEGLAQPDGAVLRLYLSGCSYAQIAAKTGLSRRQVEYRLEKFKRRIRALAGQ